MKAPKNQTTVEQKSQDNTTKASHYPKRAQIYYDVWSKSMGFQAEYKSINDAYDAIDYYWNVYCKNINSGKWKKTRYFDYYIIKRDLQISPLHSSVVEYTPGSYTEMKKEKAMRASLGDEEYEKKIIENMSE